MESDGVSVVVIVVIVVVALLVSLSLLMPLLPGCCRCDEGEGVGVAVLATNKIVAEVLAVVTVVVVGLSK